MADLSHYYGRAKEGIMNIDPREMAELGEDWLVTAGTGAALGLISASIGGLDKKFAGFPVPVDGLVSGGLALAGLTMRNKQLKIASIAAGGSAATRTFEKFFKRAIGAHGEFDEGAAQLGFGGYNPPGLPAYGWGQDPSHDRLVDAAKYL